MSLSSRKLLFTDNPKFDESFIGYLLHLSELNEFENLTWLLKLAGLERDLHYRTFPGFSKRSSVTMLAQLTGITEDILISMLYQPNVLFLSSSYPHYLIFDSFVPSCYIAHNYSRVCPHCLCEQNYLRKMWEFLPATACPFHQCLLIDICPQCSQKINVRRRSVHRCQCSFDLRKMLPVFLGTEEMCVTRRIYLFDQSANVDFCQHQKTPEILMDVHNLDVFLRIIFKLMESLGGPICTRGCPDVIYQTTERLHRSMLSAARLLSEGPVRDFKSIEQSEDESELNRLSDYQIERTGKSLRTAYPNLVKLREVLSRDDIEPQFPAIDRALKNYFNLYGVLFDDPNQDLALLGYGKETLSELYQSIVQRRQGLGRARSS